MKELVHFAQQEKYVAETTRLPPKIVHWDLIVQKDPLSQQSVIPENIVQKDPKNRCVTQDTCYQKTANARLLKKAHQMLGV